MSVKDLAFEERLRGIRRAVEKLPKHLRPTPTCVPFDQAAARLGVSPTRLTMMMRRRRWRVVVLDGKRLVPLGMIDLLRR